MSAAERSRVLEATDAHEAEEPNAIGLHRAGKHLESIRAGDGAQSALSSRSLNPRNESS